MTIDQISESISLTGRRWTVETDDEVFTTAFLDGDERRETPVPHRHFHGGFEGTSTRFSFYVDVEGGYEGRFFQHVTPFPQSEHLGPTGPTEYNKITFALSTGAAFIETNGGGPAAGDPFSGIDPTISAYRANAASAKFFKLLAQELFGPHRVFGYLYGGSGGGFRTIGAAENTDGAWDGYAPHVLGSSMAIPNVFSVRMHALRILRGKLPAIADAYDAGGDPSALELNAEERAAFDEVTRMGFPPRSWFGWRTMDLHGFSALYPGVIAADPTYVDDFWTVEGYLGADPSSSVHRDRVQLSSRIVAFVREQNDDGVSGGVDESFKAGSDRSAGRVTGVQLADTPGGWLLGAELIMRSGAAAGAVVRLSGVQGDVAVLEGWQGGLPDGVQVGDEVLLDNSSFLAVQTYHRHQVPGSEFPVWDQFRDADGAPRFPQRPVILGPLLSRGATGVEMTGRIRGKVILVEAGLDREAFPWQADWYRELVRGQLGESAEHQLRVWIAENALHGDEGPQEFPGRTVPYLGLLETALRQLVNWVEHGAEPSPTTAYEVVDGQVLLPATAEERAGAQPVVQFTANGAEHAHAAIGEPVALHATVTAPVGIVVSVQEVLGLEGDEERSQPALAIAPSANVEVRWTRSFDTAGTHFVAVRCSAQTGGNPDDHHARADNIARIRVVVGD